MFKIKYFLSICILMFLKLVLEIVIFVIIINII